MFDDLVKDTPLKKIWDEIGLRHHHGINLPLSALMSKTSCGIGEFPDLIPLIDWTIEIGMDVIQLLPLNDTGEDPSPYNALSSCALHPIYLGLSQLSHLTPELEKKLNQFVPFCKTKRINYHQVYHKKLSWLRKYLAHAGPLILETDAYQSFLKTYSWVIEYALFKALKESYKNVHWKDFPEDLKNPNHTHLKQCLELYGKKMDFYLALQFLCHKQLTEVQAYATKKQCLLKGDIPILISPDSVDVWLHRDLFDLTVSAGAPPDIFNPEGQYWGFPMYQWDVIEKQDFRWWKQRLKYASEFYHLYRIDHIIGFFRIWVVPRDKKPKFGYFLPANEDIMLAQGKLLLSAMAKGSPMLPIGEDLGVIPDEARAMMTSLGICGTKVFRWEREDNEKNTFISHGTFNPLSMSSISTHDSETLEIWWSENKEGEEYAEYKNWTHEIPLSPDKRFEILYENLHNPTLFHINLLQEYLALIPNLVHEDPHDERINIPGYVLPTNWTYRLKPTIEELVGNQELKEWMLKLLAGP